MFIKQVREQLHKMTDLEKNEWILTKAKLLPTSEQQDFLMSLTGEKIITYMPTEQEIDNFCQKVRNGDICVEFEKHYYEFDDDGRYMNDWKSWHNDPYNAFLFLNRTFKGCHDLVILKEYKLAADILNKVCNLEFSVVESKKSENWGIWEDVQDNSPFTIPKAESEQLLSMSMKEIGTDWITALIYTEGEIESSDFAKKLLGVFKLALCKELNPSDFTDGIPNNLFQLMESILEKEVLEADVALKKYNNERKYWREIYDIRYDRARKHELLLNIQMKCQHKENIDKAQQGVSVLESSWKRISELSEILRYENYIDNQWEIKEIKNICEALVTRNKLEEEEWELRKKVLQDIVYNDYYEKFNCDEQIKALSEKLCFTSEEYIGLADILSERPIYEKEGAILYKKYGKIDKYISYLETHLGIESMEYVDLIGYYANAGNTKEARKVAEQGLDNCKDDLSDIFIYLLKDAKKCGDKERYRKLYASAKRRKMSDINKINNALQSDIYS